MDTTAFFRRVLSSQPNYVLTIGRQAKEKKFFWNENYSDFESLTEASLKHDKKKHTVYFAIGSFENNVEQVEGKEKITRRATQATTFKTLACDIDVGSEKPYQTQRDAAKALLLACAAIQLPSPMLVSSGLGLHCYWPLTVEIDRLTWVRLSTVLRDSLLANGVHLDESKVCDPSMVLRPVGTSNRKSEYTLTVRVLRDCPDYDLSVFHALTGSLPRPTGVRSAKPGTAPRSPLLDAVLASQELPLAHAEQVAAKCAQIAVIAGNGGDVPEPLWYLALGVANHCIDGEAVAQKWSSGHAEYDPAKTRAKFEQWKTHATGPATCLAFGKINGNGCKNCIHKGKITTPIQLSIPAPDPVSPEIKLPDTYQITKGKLYRTIDGVAVMVSRFPIFITNRTFDITTGKAMAVVEAHTPKEGVKKIMLPIDTLAAGKDKWGAFVHNNSIAPGPFEKHTIALRQYLMTYLEELQHRGKPTETFNRFGWVDDKKFVLGETLFAPDGRTEVKLAQSITKDMREAYVPSGNLDAWLMASDFYGTKGCEFHAMCLLIGMGAPLLYFTDLEGFVVSMYSPESGTGKTTTGHMINSVWGNPKMIQIGRNDTTNAMYQTLVQQNNLPAYFEEITNIEGEDLSNFVYNVASGRNRRRLTQTAELREAGHWKLPVFTSTNRSLLAKLQNNKLVNEGEMQRIIEYPFAPNAVFDGRKNGTPTGLKIASILRGNFGVAGPILLGAYCKADMRAIVHSAYGAFEKEFNFEFNAKERFIQAAHVIAYVAAKLATKLKLISFNYHTVIEASLKHLRSAEQSVLQDRLSALDIIGQFTSEHINSTVYERTDTSSARAIPMSGKENLRSELRARFEITHNGKGVMEHGTLYIDRAYFNRWCGSIGVDASDIVSQLAGKGVGVTTARIALGRRTPYLTSAVHCYQFNLKHPEFLARLAGIDAVRETMLMLVPKENT